jgi:hypothetical protein
MALGEHPTDLVTQTKSTAAGYQTLEFALAQHI